MAVCLHISSVHAARAAGLMSVLLYQFASHTERFQDSEKSGCTYGALGKVFVFI